MERKLELSAAKMDSLRKAGVQIETYSDEMKQQFARLDDQEIAALVAIKSKLNSGLTEKLKAVADTVGGFVW